MAGEEPRPVRQREGSLYGGVWGASWSRTPAIRAPLLSVSSQMGGQ
jgi:hypothetical protein